MTRLLTARHAIAAAAILREDAAGNHGFAYALAERSGLRGLRNADLEALCAAFPAI